MGPCPRDTLGPCLETIQRVLDTGHFCPRLWTATSLSPPLTRPPVSAPWNPEQSVGLSPCHRFPPEAQPHRLLLSRASRPAESQALSLPHPLLPPAPRPRSSPHTDPPSVLALKSCVGCRKKAQQSRSFI